MKLECLRAVVSYYEWKCPLTLCAASPRARVAVELNRNYKCGVFRISVDETRTMRDVRVHLYELYRGRVREDEEAMIDWWLLRRETCLPIMFQAYRPDTILRRHKMVNCCIEVSAMLPIVQTMRMHASASSLSWVDKCTRLESLYAAECLCPISFSGFCNSACLTVLNVSFSKVKSFDGISGCVNLELLNVCYCTGTGDFSPIGRCSRLQRLEIDGCRTIRDFSWIGQLKALTYLSMNNLELEDIGWIDGCASLESLLMTGSSCKDYHPITALKTLGMLEFYGTDVSDVQWTKNMDSLESVNVRYGSNVESVIIVMRSRYPDAKSWRDVLQACGAFKRIRDNSGSNNSREASGAFQAEQQE